ncbi:MAG: adenylate kinase [Candidatus Berkelbacteria bacterium Licking1014_7]|uniref:Adenylate kinase n=1 Tax=Candidatus Berkelbacteria bacterium Licking1014_7 TaxID=2017147 RepID=A0A554LI50_9BACT|nr:MAG: adenylate kinase [Candidatus Berkelbacteria bacterium Licking1014_7]
MSALQKINLKTRKVTLCILGIPGSGKGTQAKFLAKKFNLTHIETGNLVREYILSRKAASDRYQKGIPQPSPVINKLVENEISRQLQKKCDRFILDPYPLKISEAKHFLKIVKKYRLANPYVIFLKTNPQLVLQRIIERAKTQGRTDDNIQTVQKRINHYQKELKPILKYFSRKKLLLTVDGDQTIKNVKKELFSRFRQN